MRDCMRRDMLVVQQPWHHVLQGHTRTATCQGPLARITSDYERCCSITSYDSDCTLVLLCMRFRMCLLGMFCSS